MTISISTKPQAKTIVSALRRELKALDKGTASLSHNDCLALMAKALGFPSWNAWEATLSDGTAVAVASAGSPVAVTSKYPLDNLDGKFDFIAKDMPGQPFSGHLDKLEGTYERLYGTSGIMAVTREGEHGGFFSEYEGGTEVDWEKQATVKSPKGFDIWLDENGNEFSQAFLVIAPEGCESVEDEEDLPLREALIGAFLQYFSEEGASAEALDGNFRAVEDILAFSLTSNESEELHKRLTQPELI